jgi:hypothetical protein
MGNAQQHKLGLMVRAAASSPLNIQQGSTRTTSDPFKQYFAIELSSNEGCARETPTNTCPARNASRAPSLPAGLLTGHGSFRCRRSSVEAAVYDAHQAAGGGGGFCAFFHLGLVLRHRGSLSWSASWRRAGAHAALWACHIGISDEVCRDCRAYTQPHSLFLQLKCLEFVPLTQLLYDKRARPLARLKSVRQVRPRLCCQATPPVHSTGSGDASLDHHRSAALSSTQCRALTPWASKRQSQAMRQPRRQATMPTLTWLPRPAAWRRQRLLWPRRAALLVARPWSWWAALLLRSPAGMRIRPSTAATAQ